MKIDFLLYHTVIAKDHLGSISIFYNQSYDTMESFCKLNMQIFATLAPAKVNLLESETIILVFNESINQDRFPSGFKRSTAKIDLRMISPVF